MAHGPRYRVKRRRRREGKTDYKTRLALLKAGAPRVVVRRSLRNFTVQFVEYDETGDRVVAQADARDLADLGWSHSTSNTPAAYLTGLLAGTRALEAGVDEGVLDLGRQKPARGGNIFAVLQGVLDAGVDVPHGDGIFPPEDRLRGDHIGDGVAGDFDDVAARITGDEASTAEADETDDEDDASEDADGAQGEASDQSEEDE